MKAPLSLARAARLRPALESLLSHKAALVARVEADPVRFPRRYRARPLDAELVGAIAACLAYGKVSAFAQKLETLFAGMGEHPSRFAQDFVPGRDGERIDIAYRFNTSADIAALVAALGRVQKEEGSLGACFAKGYSPAEGTLAALGRFVARLRDAANPAIEALGPSRIRAFDHLLPDPASGGACKRWMLFLRWMIRGGEDDPVDLGLWRFGGLDASRLIVPLDTHVARVGVRLGLTRRSDLSMKTALEVTASLTRLDPLDPVKYDFALCHLGMSGLCPATRKRDLCRRCPLSGMCRGEVR